LLDEVDALSLEQQVKLLRVVETGEFEPVGSNETRLRRARVIAASNIDLEQAVAEGKFRQDLFYRLSVLTIQLLPLRERVADIGPLARELAARLNAKFGKGLYDISAEALALLGSFSWPGNVRQLENTIQRAVLASRGPVLLPEHLPGFLRRRDPDPLLVIAGPLTTDLDQHEKRAVEQALAEAGYSRSRAARALGVCRATLYNKMKKHGIVPPQRLG
jgi:transcriptional regulator with PAS, ATPase and Fis domain